MEYTIKSFRNFFLFSFYSSIINGDPYPDPSGRYRKRGAVDLPVIIQIRVHQQALQSMTESLTKHKFADEVID